jgi:CBS-domain-containing membrane protein
MVPLSEYPSVEQEVTLFDAVVALDRAQQGLPPGRQPYRAVLVVDSDKRVVGKIGQLALLKALEPQSTVVDDLGTLTRAGVSDEFLNSVMKHFRLFQQEISNMCLTARSLPVKNVMHPVAEHIDHEASLCEAAHQMVVWQTLSILVTEGNETVGLIRLSDLCDEVVRQMKAARGEEDE